MARPKISVIIPTTAAALRPAVRAGLERQTRPPDEVIVCHDSARRGPAFARNAGIARATGDCLAFLDDDCVPPPEWLAALVEAQGAYDADVVGGPYEEIDAFLQARRNRRRRPDRVQIDETGLVGAGGNLMLARRAVDGCLAADGYVFNEAFRISQDWELIWRLRRRGARLAYVPVAVTHLRQTGPVDHLVRQFGRGVGISMLYRLQRRDAFATTLHASRIWSPGGVRFGGWLRALLATALGPFDRRAFSTRRAFALHWLGEKAQAAGFLYGVLRRRRYPLEPPASEVRP